MNDNTYFESLFTILDITNMIAERIERQYSFDACARIDVIFHEFMMRDVHRIIYDHDEYMRLVNACHEFECEMNDRFELDYAITIMFETIDIMLRTSDI